MEPHLIGEPHAKLSISTNAIEKYKRNRENASASKISVKEFLDFLKTAYQVQESLEGILLAGGMNDAVNWLKLKENDMVKSISCQTSADRLSIEEKKSQPEEKKEVVRRKSDTSIPESDPIKQKLNDVLAEGLLDSVLPYIVPSQSLKKISQTKLIEKSSSSILNVSNASSQSTEKLSRKKSLDISSSTKSSIIKADTDVEIHVCDEVKNIKKDFFCNQQLLVEKMGYFADVTTGQRLEDMDISVHCDIDVFEWLMKWVKRESLLEEDWPQLDAQSVVSVLVSSAFLQMEPLVQDCLLYCHQHMNDILRTTANLSCINDALLTRLAAMYTNVEVESIRDRKDKIQSRLFCKLILSLGEPEPESMRGHWSSLARLYLCSKCHQYVTPSVSMKIPCASPCMRLQRDGSVVSNHVRDLSWNINEHILKLHKNLKTWRKVYWRLWGEAHYLYCMSCKRFFPAHQIGWCRYHPDPPQFFTLDTQKAPLPVGRYPCCGERAYRFQLLHNYAGCQFREHTVCTKNVRDSAVVSMLENYRHLIEEEPPELLFPERLTRLVARDPSSNDTKLQCKEVFWWEGFEIIPPRPKLGLLSTFMARLKDLGSEPSEVEQQTSSTEEESEDEISSSSNSMLSVGSEESNIIQCKGPLKVNTPRKCKGKKKKKVGHLWQHNLSARSNQDIQRAYEESALKQMTNILNKRTSDGTLKVGKTVGRNVAPLGGIWVRLEAEFNNNHNNNNNATNSSNQTSKVRNIFTGKIKSKVYNPPRF